MHWQPPEEALEKVRGLIDEPATSNYGADEGLPDLRAALLEKAYVIEKHWSLGETLQMVISCYDFVCSPH